MFTHTLNTEPTYKLRFWIKFFHGMHQLTSSAISWISGVAGLGSDKPPSSILANCFFAGRYTGTEMIRLAWGLGFLKRLVLTSSTYRLLFFAQGKMTEGSMPWDKPLCFLSRIANRNMEKWGTEDEQMGGRKESHCSKNQASLHSFWPWCPPVGPEVWNQKPQPEFPNVLELHAILFFLKEYLLIMSRLIV